MMLNHQELQPGFLLARQSPFHPRSQQVRYTNSATRIPEFPIEPELALELLMAANFLDC